jgi:hypothetical protein
MTRLLKFMGTYALGLTDFRPVWFTVLVTGSKSARMAHVTGTDFPAPGLASPSPAWPSPARAAAEPGADHGSVICAAAAAPDGLTPDELSGHALGLHSSGMLALQGVGAALPGTVAEQTSPATAVVTVALALGLRGPALRAPARPELAIPGAEDQHFQQRGAEGA